MLDVLRLPLSVVGRLRDRLAGARYARRLDRWRARGMHIGRDVNIPECLYIDEDDCAMIRIEDSTSFGPECMVLAHDTVRAGAVVLRQSCHVGARSIVLPGVEVGPRTVIAANSIVTRSLPPDTVCAGQPARPFSTLQQYLEMHRVRLADAKRFPYDEYSIQYLTPERCAALVSAVLATDTYIVGGRSAELRRSGGSARTPLDGYEPPPPEPLPSADNDGHLS